MALKVVRPSPVPRMVVLVDDYLASKTAKGVSSKTLAQYGFALREVFLPFLAQEGITEPEQLDNRTMDRLSDKLLNEGGKRGPLSRETVHSYLRPVRWFIHWVNDPENRVNSKIDANVQLPSLKGRQRVRNVLDPAEMKAMATAAEQRNPRDALIFEILSQTGMRAGELVRLRPSDLRRSTKQAAGRERQTRYFLHVRGKGDRYRLVPVMPGLFRALDGFVDRQRKLGQRHGDEEEPIFLSHRRSRRTGDFEPLTVSGVEQLIRSIAADAGITKRVFPHLLRHSVATNFLKSGGSALNLKDVLGHADLTMITRHYGHLTEDDAYDAMARYLRDR